MCVCVNHLNRCKTSLVFRFGYSQQYAGGHSISLGLCPTKLPVKWDIQLGQLDVPAIFHFPFSVHGIRLSPEPARRIFDFSVTSSSVRFSQAERFHSGTLTRLFQPTVSQNEHEVFF